MGEAQKGLERKTANSYLLSPKDESYALNLILTSLQHSFVDFVFTCEEIEARGGCLTLSHTTNKQQIKDLSPDFLGLSF